MTTLSKCCSAPIKVAGGKEGTNWYECEKCGKTPSEMRLDFVDEEMPDDLKRQIEQTLKRMREK
jgi:hypothetical protein